MMYTNDKVKLGRIKTIPLTEETAKEGMQVFFSRQEGFSEIMNITHINKKPKEFVFKYSLGWDGNKVADGTDHISNIKLLVIEYRDFFDDDKVKQVPLHLGQWQFAVSSEMIGKPVHFTITDGVALADGITYEDNTKEKAVLTAYTLFAGFMGSLIAVFLFCMYSLVQSAKEYGNFEHAYRLIGITELLGALFAVILFAFLLKEYETKKEAITQSKS